MCGQRALEYVRFRHTDTDIVRGARQQDFLRQIRQQLSVGELISNNQKLIDIFADNTASDIQSSSALRQLLKAALGVISKPITQVRFHARLGESYVFASPAQVRQAVRQFLRRLRLQGAALEAAQEGPQRPQRQQEAQGQGEADRRHGRRPRAGGAG